LILVRCTGSLLDISIKTVSPVKTINIGYIDTEQATLYAVPFHMTVGDDSFLGLDAELLDSKVISFALISFTYANHEYITTRLFMKRMGLEVPEDKNGRTYIVLSMKKFDLENAMLSDRVHDGTQLEFFQNKSKTEVKVDGKIC
jgi:hypothetical protein